MAGNLTPYYLLQSAFTGGEISDEVANRVDLDKYQFAMLQARNCMVRPYGPVYRRPGMKYIARAKYSDKQAILVPFNGADGVDYLLEIGDKYIRVYKDGQYLNVEVTTPFAVADLPNLRFTQSADVMFIASGTYPVKQLARYSDTSWTFSDFAITDMYFDDSIISSSENATITPSGRTGSVTLTASEGIFTSAMVGMQVKLMQNVPASEVSVSNGTTGSLYAGESWKIITHGTWTGTVTVQKSIDNATWENYRTYSAKNDYNPLESGSLSEGAYLRAVCSVSSGTCNVSLSTLPYNKEGIAKITAFTNSTHVTASVTEAFGTTNATKIYSFGAWCNAFGYPKTIGFFQDRMIFGGTMKQPYMLWMSRTGDYGNFSVEKVSGTVTDDSAVAIGLVSRKQYQILHLVPSTDLLILTAGNEWTISGGSTVTPANVSVRMQTTCGCSSCEPIMADGRIVFVQGRGSTVRDMGYSYDTDSYGGNDLTLLAKHIIQGIKIVDSAYKQEPDSTLYFVRSDGTMACLAYILDQKVYAWSTVDTDGNIEAVAAVQEGDEDIVYVLVKRNIAGQEVRNIECLHNNNAKSNVPNDYIMLDCAVAVSNEIAVDSGDEIENDDNTASRIFSVPELAGATVDVLGDGRAFEGITVGENGELELPASVTSIVAGLPYKMVIELPNVEIKTGDGTMQGRFKQVSECTLRLSNSCGGQVGCTEDSMDRLPYDELSAVTDVRLFSGDKVITLPVGGFNNEGRAVIVSDEPYPFNLLAIVRKVTFGG